MRIFRQVLAVARTEFRFSFRRGAPVVVTALIGLVVAAAILLAPLANLENSVSYEDRSPEQIAWLTEMGITESVFQSLNRDTLIDITAYSTTEGWFLIYLALLFLPIATIGAVPADRQHGVFELLRSAPLTGTTYLAGKVIGSVGIVLFIAIFPLLLFLAILEGVLVSAYQYGIPSEMLTFYAKLALLDGLPILACGAAIGVFTGIAIPSRKAAIVPGFVVGIASIFAWSKGFHAPGIYSNNTDLAANFIFQGYQSLSQTTWQKYLGPDAFPFDLSLLGAEAPVIHFGQVVLMYAAILVVLLGIAVLTRLWLYRKENF